MVDGRRCPHRGGAGMDSHATPDGMSVARKTWSGVVEEPPTLYRVILKVWLGEILIYLEVLQWLDVEPHIQLPNLSRRHPVSDNA